MGTHPIFESDFDCLTVRRDFFRATCRIMKILILNRVDPVHP